MSIFDYELVNRSNSVTEVDRLKQKFVGNPKIETGIFEDGLSRFQLNTFDGNTEIINTGLLEEMPEFTFSVDYTDGPGTLWQDMLQEFMENDLFNIINAIGAANSNNGWKNIMQGGSWTKKVYNGYNPGSISLKFKVFTDDNLGQTSAQTWIDRLNKYAAISNKNSFSFNQAFKNIESGLGNVKGSTSKLVQEFMKLMNKDNAKAEEENNKSDEEEMIDKAKEKHDKCEQKIQDLRAVKFFNRLDGTTSRHEFSTKEKGYKYLYFTVNCSTRKDSGNDQFQLIITLYGNRRDNDSDNNLNYQDKTDWYDYDEYNIQTAIDKISELVKDQTGSNVYADLIKKAYEKALKEIDALYAEPTKPNNNMQRHLDKLAAVKSVLDNGNKALNTAIKKYGPNRVADTFNKQNSFGAKLWYLHLYSGTIFKKATPLIVYVSDWSVKRSEEANLDGPYYYEFNITCNLDQTYSRAQWYRVLETDITNGANWGKQKESQQMQR